MKTKKKLSALAAFIYLLLAFSLAHAKNVQCGAFNFEQRKQISIQDLGRLADHEILSGDNGSIAFYYFDEEDRPHKEGFYAAGIVFARVGDLGETPVGGYIWSPNSVKHVRFEKTSREGGDLSVQLSPGLGDSACVISPLIMILKERGQLFVNGQPVGTVK